MLEETLNSGDLRAGLDCKSALRVADFQLAVLHSIINF